MVQKIGISRFYSITVEQNNMVENKRPNFQKKANPTTAETRPSFWFKQ